MKKFHTLGVTFDRIPYLVRKNNPQYAYNEYQEHRECYVIPGKPCIQKASENDHGTCDGVCKNGEICPNLFNRPADYQRARNAALRVVEKREYAYGKRTKMEPGKDFKRVLAMLFNNKQLCEHYSEDTFAKIGFSGGRTVDLREVTYG